MMKFKAIVLGFIFEVGWEFTCWGKRPAQFGTGERRLNGRDGRSTLSGSALGGMGMGGTGMSGMGMSGMSGMGMSGMGSGMGMSGMGSGMGMSGMGGMELERHGRNEQRHERP